MPSVIDIAGLTKRYAGNFALKNVDLVIPVGVTGLLGPNGSGKSTFIKAVLGLVRVDTGSGIVLGGDWPKQVKSIRDKIGYLPEDDCYILGLQGVESVQMMAKLSVYHRPKHCVEHMKCSISVTLGKSAIATWKHTQPACDRN